MPGELATFGEWLRKSEIARFDLEKEQLDLERKRHIATIIEREKDRDEHREGRREERQMRAEDRKVQFDMAMLKFKEIIFSIRSSPKE